jgi:hypothetical protein
MASKEWLAFNKKHRFIDRESIKNGSILKMVCKCGWSIELRNNSGLPLGMKVAWWNHFYSIYPSLSKTKSIENNDVEVEFPKCVKCDNLAAALVEKGWKSSEKEILNVCPEHLKEFENFPGFNIIYIGSGEKLESLIVSKLILENNETNLELESVTSSVSKTNSSSPKTAIKWVAVLVFLAIIGSALNSYDSAQNKKIAVNNLNMRNEMAKNCFSIEGEDAVAKSGPVGSAIRQENTVYYYENVIKSSCVVWGDGSIFSNPFYNVDKNSPNWQQLINALNYTAKRWNLSEPFYLQCADGWNSPSIGKRGACSHHGGVVSPFLDNPSWNLVNQFKSAERLYGSLVEMNEATR